MALGFAVYVDTIAPGAVVFIFNILFSPTKNTVDPEPSTPVMSKLVSTDTTLTAPDTPVEKLIVKYVYPVLYTTNPIPVLEI